MEYSYGVKLSQKQKDVIKKHGYERILFQKGAISRITLNEPQRSNPIGIRMVTEIGSAMDEVLADDKCRVILVDANGKNFSGGHDLSEKETLDEKELAWRERSDDHIAADDYGTCLWLLDNWYYKVWDYPKPIVAAVHGHVTAGAIEFTQMCDIVVAAPDTKFGYASFIRVSTGTSEGQLATWVLGWKKCAEMMVCGMRIGAADALHYGLVNRVVPKEKLIEEAMVFCENIVRMPSTGVMHNKKVLRHIWNTMMGVRNGMMWGAHMDVYGHMLRQDRQYAEYYIKGRTAQEAVSQLVKDTKERWKEADARQEQQFAKQLETLDY